MGIQERKEREKEQRRQSILCSARDVFFEKGLQNTTMDEIAERAELSKGTLYLYYRSKEDLYLAVVVEGLELLYGMFIRATNDSSSAIVALGKIAEVYLEFFDTHKSYFRMFQFFQSPQFHRQVSEEMLGECTRQNMKLWNYVTDLIKRGIADGEIKKDLSADETTVLLWSAVNALMTRIDLEQDYWKSHLDLDLRGVLRKSFTFLLGAISTSQTLKV